MVICRKSRWLCVMVRSAAITHPTTRGLGRKTTSLSFVAFERLIDADPGSPRNRGKLSVRTQIQNVRTGEVPSNMEEFEGMSTRLH
jgi:hypothetical protein